MFVDFKMMKKKTKKKDTRNYNITLVIVKYPEIRHWFLKPPNSTSQQTIITPYTTRKIYLYIVNNTIKYNTQLCAYL